MRFVWAVVAFVIAAVLIGAGIAQRTVFMGPKTEQAAIEVQDDLAFTLIDGAVLGKMPGAQTLRASGDGDIFAAYGRTADMQAWLSDVTYNAVTLDDEGEIVTAVIEPVVIEEEPADGEGTEDAAEEATEDAAAEEATEDAAAEEEPAEPGRSPIGSDLWLDEFQQEDLLIAKLQLPAEMSVLLAADGTAAAPTEIAVTWPIDNSTPWAGPLIALGGVFLAGGVFLYILGIRHVRRSRGPRRKGPPPLPPTEPIDLSEVEGEIVEGEIEAGDAEPTGDDGATGALPEAPERKGIAQRVRAFAVVPAIAVAGLLFTGCSADAWPQFGEPTPTPTETEIIMPEGQQAPAVTLPQAERILARVAETAAAADEAMDADLAATRLSGAVLAERETNYTLRAANADYATPAEVPAKPVEIILPQTNDGWPRTFMAVVADDDPESTAAPRIMMLTQEDSWSEYKLSNIASMEAAVVMPELAPARFGATLVQPDSPFLVMQPDQVAAAYADVLNKGEDSEFYPMFEAEGDHFRVQVADGRAKTLAAFNETGAETGTMSFEAAAGSFDPIAIATLESGAIVAVTLIESESVVPTNEDAVIKLDGNTTVKTLTGLDQSAKGFTRIDSDQLFFYVPGQGSNQQIRLLGYSSSILSAKENE